MHSTNSITESKPYSVTPFPIYQSLHLLRKRDKNSTENFVHGAKKAVKSRTMLGAIKKQFSEKAGPLVLSSFLALGSLIPGFTSTAQAEPGAAGTQIAMNTPKAEGSGTTVQPASHTPAPQVEKESPCADMNACTRKEAYNASTGKIMFHYGEGIKRIGWLVAALERDGYIVLALSGGSKDFVEMRIDKSAAVKFTQEDLDNGTLGGIAIDQYTKRVGLPTPHDNVAALDR